MNIRYSFEEKDCWEHLYSLGFSSIQIANIRGVKQPSVKGHIKAVGLSRSHSEAQKGREPWNKGETGVQVPWNKGKKGVQVSTRKGTTQPKRGPRKSEHIEKIKQGWKLKLDRGWDGFGGFGQKPTPEQRMFPAILYLVRYLDESGTHFKIGITRRTLQQRLGDRLVSILHLHYATLGECFDLEQKLLKWAKDSGYRYSSNTTTELIHPAAIPLLLKNDNFYTFTTPEGVV
jgi:hypothetical protein